MSLVTWSKDTQDWETPPYLSTSFQNSIVSEGPSRLRYQSNISMQDGSPGNYRQNTVNSVKRIITIYKSRSINSPIWPADNCTLFATAKSAAFAALYRETRHSKGQTMPTRGLVRKDAALHGQSKWEKPRER